MAPGMKCAIDNHRGTYGCAMNFVAGNDFADELRKGFVDTAGDCKAQMVSMHSSSGRASSPKCATNLGSLEHQHEQRESAPTGSTLSPYVGRPRGGVCAHQSTSTPLPAEVCAQEISFHAHIGSESLLGRDVRALPLCPVALGGTDRTVMQSKSFAQAAGRSPAGVSSSQPDLACPRGITEVGHILDTASTELGDVNSGSGGLPATKAERRSAKKGPALRAVAEMRGHQGAIYACKFSASGEWLVSAGFDTTLKLWSSRPGVEQSGRETCELKSFTGHTQLISALAVLPCDKEIVSGAYDRSLRCWDVEGGHEIVRIDVEGMVQAVAVGRTPESFDFKRGLDSAGQSSDDEEPLDGNASYLEDLRSTGGAAAEPVGSSNSRTTSGASDDSFLVYVGSTSKYLMACDLRTGSVVAKWESPAPVTSINTFCSAANVELGSAGRRIMTADGNGAILVWDARTGGILLRESIDPSEASDIMKGNAPLNTHVDPEGAAVIGGGIRNGGAGRFSAKRNRSSALHVSCLAAVPAITSAQNLHLNATSLSDGSRVSLRTGENRLLRRLDSQEAAADWAGAFVAALSHDNTIRIVERCSYDRSVIAEKAKKATAIKGLAAETSIGSRCGDTDLFPVDARVSELPGVMLRTKQVLRGPQLRNWPIGASWWKGADLGVEKQDNLPTTSAYLDGTGDRLDTDALNVDTPAPTLFPWSQSLVLASGSADGRIYLYDIAKNGLMSMTPVSAEMMSQHLLQTDSLDACDFTRTLKNSDYDIKGRCSDVRDVSLGGIEDDSAAHPVGNKYSGRGAPSSLIQVLSGHRDRVYCVDWSPIEPCLASGSADGVVRLWRPKSG